VVVVVVEPVDMPVPVAAVVMAALVPDLPALEAVGAVVQVLSVLGRPYMVVPVEEELAFADRVLMDPVVLQIPEPQVR